MKLRDSIMEFEKILDIFIKIGCGGVGRFDLGGKGERGRARDMS